MITITKPGLLSTIQDLGRFGNQKYGVITSGAMDSLAHRLANLLVGNEENKPTIEMTFLGPSVQFQEDALIAICGGDLSPTIQDRPVPMWRPVLVKNGAVLKFGHAQTGTRSYLAVAGGFSIPPIMNSTSTYLRANLGGYHGRALKKGDKIAFAEKSHQSNKLKKKLINMGRNLPFVKMNCFISSELIPKLERNPVIRVMKGRQYQLFTKESQERLWTEPFQISPQSDRMGYRLKGAMLRLEKAIEMLSEAVTFGTIQVPADGNPIILMADRQTTGGYPKIGEIASVDLPLLAQVKPDDTIHFTNITLEEAQQLYLEREKKIKQLKHGIYHL